LIARSTREDSPPSKHIKRKNTRALKYSSIRRYLGLEIVEKDRFQQWLAIGRGGLPGIGPR